MSFRSKTVLVGALVAGTLVLTASVSGQDTKTAPDNTDRPAKVERGDRPFGMHPGMGRFGRGGRHHRGMHRGARAFLRGIDLTEAQRVQIRSIFEANRPIRENMEAIRPLIEAKRNGTITPAQQEQLDSFKASAKERARSVRDQIMAVLTPEQKAQIEQKKLEMKTRMEERRRLRDEQKKARPAETVKPVQ